MFVPVKCHVRTLGYKLGWIPTSLACPVVVLCSVCLVFRRTEFQGHLKQLRHAVVWSLILRLSGLSMKIGGEGNARQEFLSPRSNRGNKIQNGRHGYAYELSIVFIWSRVDPRVFLFLIFYFTFSLHFTLGLQSAVCSLHFTPGLQSAVCVLHYTDRDDHNLFTNDLAFVL